MWCNFIAETNRPIVYSFFSSFFFVTLENKTLLKHLQSFILFIHKLNPTPLSWTSNLREHLKVYLLVNPTCGLVLGLRLGQNVVQQLHYFAQIAWESRKNAIDGAVYGAEMVMK